MRTLVWALAPWFAIFLFHYMKYNFFLSVLSQSEKKASQDDHSFASVALLVQMAHLQNLTLLAI